MAAVGPVTSFAIGVLALVLVGVSADPAVRALAEVDMEQALAALGPVATILAWLGPINIVLGVFNLVPGFPLDGGRVFRALLWAITGDLHRATRWATTAGKGVAALLMMLGVAMSFGVYVPFLGGGLGSGVWILFIGWFLFKAAQMSWDQLIAHEALGDARIGDMMRRQVYTVREDLTIEAFVRDYVMNSDQGSFPVTRDERLVGVAEAEAVSNVPRERWSSTPVAAIAEGGAALETVRVDACAEDAVRRLGAGVKQLAVLDEDKLVGIVRQQDLIKFLSLRMHAQPG
jgi:CBS domain-containing protein